MGFLQKLGQGQGYLKAGFLGFPKSGKSYTATLVALGLIKHLGLNGPIAMFDTEGGSEYLAAMIREGSGQDLMGVKSRSFDDLMGMARECESDGVSVLLVDSITHVWRELMASYMKKLNERLTANGRRAKSRMDIQDIMTLKELWSVWPDLYLNSKLHIIICGRAGFEWDMEKDEETGKNVLMKTGVKMKVESEFGFEPSLLVEMERVQELGDITKITHRATVIGDRFHVIDGQVGHNPTFDFFKPHIALLTPGAHAPIDTAIKSEPNVDEDGNPEWQREKKERAIYCEEIQADLLAKFPSQSAQDKYAKATLIKHVFKTGSWTKVEGLNSEALKLGLSNLRNILNDEDSLKAILMPETQNA